MNAKNLTQAYFYRYHNLTKHTKEKLFASGRSLDWANQPNPFRHYEGTELIDLPRDWQVGELGFFELPAPDSVPFDQHFLSSLLFHSFAISAWKQVKGTNHKWALRVNPSSGNLHPTEVHLFFEGGAYHYRVDEHRLERRADFDLRSDLWSLLGQKKESMPPLLICLSSIFWREAWKYEARAFRYCQHDLGHALAALEVSAKLHGWSSVNFALFEDVKMTELLGFSDNQEHPLAFIGLYPGSKIGFDFGNSKEFGLISEPDTKPVFKGLANELSSEQISYPLIDKVFESTCFDQNECFESRELFTKYDIKEDENLIDIMFGSDPGNVDAQSIACKFPVINKKPKACKVIRTRRSAVDMDQQTSISKEVLDVILLQSTKGFKADFQTLKEDRFNLIHLFLYLHKVEGVKAGLYYFDRIKERLVALRTSNQGQFARFASCFQDIASDGAFAVSMVADFNTGMKVFAERCYRLVHFEAGYIGQQFYLNSHALGLDATGIGCFLDDAINSYIELPKGFEVIYNFTFGSAVQDSRLTTLPSYDFERK